MSFKDRKENANEIGDTRKGESQTLFPCTAEKEAAIINEESNLLIANRAEKTEKNDINEQEESVWQRYNQDFKGLSYMYRPTVFFPDPTETLPGMVEFDFLIPDTTDTNTEGINEGINALIADHTKKIETNYRNEKGESVWEKCNEDLKDLSGMYLPTVFVPDPTETLPGNIQFDFPKPDTTGTDTDGINEEIDHLVADIIEGYEYIDILVEKQKILLERLEKNKDDLQN